MSTADARINLALQSSAAPGFLTAGGSESPPFDPLSGLGAFDGEVPLASNNPARVLGAPCLLRSRILLRFSSYLFEGGFCVFLLFRFVSFVDLALSVPSS